MKSSVPSKEGVGGGVSLLRGQQIKLPTTHHLNQKTRGEQKVKVISQRGDSVCVWFRISQQTTQTNNTQNW
jgi:hypothetical protein